MNPLLQALSEFEVSSELQLMQLEEKYKIDQRQLTALWFIGRLTKDYKLKDIIND